VWIGKDPRDVLRITGLGRSIIDAGFKTKDECELQEARTNGMTQADNS
jgi:hypothetical protein